MAHRPADIVQHLHVLFRRFVLEAVVLYRVFTGAVVHRQAPGKVLAALFQLACDDLHEGQPRLLAFRHKVVDIFEGRARPPQAKAPRIAEVLRSSSACSRRIDHARVRLTVLKFGCRHRKFRRGILHCVRFVEDNDPAICEPLLEKIRLVFEILIRNQRQAVTAVYLQVSALNNLRLILLHLVDPRRFNVRREPPVHGHIQRPLSSFEEVVNDDEQIFAGLAYACAVAVYATLAESRRAVLVAVFVVRRKLERLFVGDRHIDSALELDVADVAVLDQVRRYIQVDSLVRIVHAGQCGRLFQGRRVSDRSGHNMLGHVINEWLGVVPVQHALLNLRHFRLAHLRGRVHNLVKVLRRLQFEFRIVVTNVVPHLAHNAQHVSGLVLTELFDGKRHQGRIVFAPRLVYPAVDYRSRLHSVFFGKAFAGRSVYLALAILVLVAKQVRKGILGVILLAYGR